MSTRESLSRRCILLKQVPDDIDEECIHRRIHGVEKSHRYNEFSIEPCEVRWVVLLANIESAERLIRDSQVPVLNCDGTECNLRVGPCPECIIPDDWLEPLTPERISMNFPDDQMMDSIGMGSIRDREQESNAPKTDNYKKMEDLKLKKDQDKNVPKFLHSNVPSLCSHQNKETVSNSNLYTSKINEAQVCVSKSCLSEPESPACKTEEIRDNGKKEEIQDENDQDIYVPTFFIPPIPIISNGHAVDVDYAEIKSVNKAQVCVDDSFLSKSGSPDSESKEMESMGIERSIASDTKCSPVKDAFGTYDGLKKSERYTMTEGLAMKESMERLNESPSQSSSLHLKNRRRSASLRQIYQIHEIPKRKTQSFQPRKRAGKQPPLLEPPSPSTITDPPEVQMNLAFELSQPIPGPSYTLGAQATPPLERLPSHQLQDLAERISVILKDRWGPQSHEEDKPTGSEGKFDTIRVRLKQPLKQDTLENYFENKRKSGGGDIDSLTIIKGTEMEVEEVLITFSECKDAMNCLYKQYMIDKRTLNAQKYDLNDPSLWEMDKALVTGLNPATTDDTVMNFLEPAAGVEAVDLVKGAQEDVAVMMFAEKPAAEKLVRDSQVPVLSCGGTECNLRVGPCPECIIPDDWLEPLTPNRISMNFSDDQMMDNIGMGSIREREQENNAPKTDLFKRVEEKEEEEENQKTYVPKFLIPAISSPYSGPDYMADSNDSRPYSSIKSQLTEEKDEANHDSNPGVTKSEDFDSDPEKVPTMVNVSSRKNGVDEDPYATIDGVDLKSFIQDHDMPPSLPERPGKTESKDEFSSTYLEPVSISKKNGAKETESASDEYQSNNPWNGGDHPDKLQCAQPQILSNPNAEVNASTYIEPLKRNSSANESNKQIPLSLPSKPHKENHFQQYENASIGSNMKVPTSLEENSNTGCQTTTNTAKLYPVIGEDCNKIPQTLVNEAYKSQGAIPKVTRRNTHPGSVGKDVDALYQNHEMIKRPDPSSSVPETGQNRPDRMPAGFIGATPAPGNFVDQTEAKFVPQNGPVPPFFPNFMMAPLNPQNQQIPMPNFMDPKYQQQQNIQGFPRTPYPGFPVPFFPFGHLPNQGNNIPQTGEIIPMPEPQLPVVPKEAEGEIPVAKTEEVESETKNTNLLASPQRRKKKQIVTPKLPNQGSNILQTRVSISKNGAKETESASDEYQSNNPGKDVDALYQNHDVIKRPDSSPSVPDTGQNRPDRMPTGFSGATPAPSNFVDQSEAKFAPQNGPPPPFFPNCMMAPLNPQNQQIPMPNFMDPKYQQQQNIQGFPRTPYPGFPVPFCPFGQLPNQGNNIPQTGDAMNCPQQQHIIDKKTLNVQKYDPNDPSLWEMDKALVTGLNPVTTEDTLMNFLEPAAGVKLEDLVRGAQEDVAIVVFAEKPDFAKMSKRCKEKKLEGNTLFIQMVEKCRTIYVKGIDKSITYDLVDNFFCNKRKSGGGDVEKVNYHPEDGYCIVYFENPSDAKNAAAKEKFTINDREIQAQMYFPCLGLPEQPMNWEDMPCVSYEGNEYIVKLVKNLPKECSQIEEALQKKFVKVEWPKSKSDFTVKLQCTVTKDVENAKEILKSWKKWAEAEMDRHMNKYVCQKHSTVPEAWSALLQQFKTLTTDQPERVVVFLDKKKHTVIVAGYEENTEALTRIILDLIKTEESKIQNQTEKIMKNIPLDFHKCQQLWKTNFGKKLTNDFPDLDFQVEINKEEVNMTGKPAEVNEALIMMHEYLMNTKLKSLNISKGRYEIFMKKEVKERFIAEMKAKGNKAVWSVTKDKVKTTSLNSKMADEALEIFKELIPEKRIQMSDLVKVLTMHDWQACVKELRDKHDEKLSVSSSSSGVCVTATKDIFENVYKTIKHVLKICSEKCGIDCKVVKNYKRQGLISAPVL